MKTVLTSRTWVPALLATLLCACTGSRIHSQVTGFHELPPSLDQRSFAVVPFPEQQGSLSHQSYARQLQAQLQAHGMRPSTLEQADVVALLSYSIDDGRERLHSYPVYGTTGVYTSTRVVTHTDGSRSTYVTNVPVTGAIGTATSSQTEYTRRLKLELLDRAAWQRGELQQKAEFTLTSRGENGDLNRVMPTLIQALFKGFPGTNGQTVEVRLPLPKVETLQ